MSVRAFLDANILARPVTRTLLLAGGAASGFAAVFSQTALVEADRHLGPGKAPVSELVTRFGWDVSPTGAGASRFTETDAKDRQLLADAVAAGASFLVTDDVDDYAEADLIEAGIGAVAADLFLEHRLSAAGYLTALDVLGVGRARPPRTPAELHAALGRQHPRLVTAHGDLFDVEPQPPTHPEPTVVYRGRRCLRCLALLPHGLVEAGVCSSCVEEDRPHQVG